MQWPVSVLAVVATLAALHAASVSTDEPSTGQGGISDKCFFSMMNCALWRSDCLVSAPMSFSKGIPFALKKGLGRYYNRKSMEKNVRYLMARV